MKFFSNEAKDDSGYDREHSDVVTSDPVAVPQQRAGSPWSDAPGGSTDTDTDAARTDTDTDAARTDTEDDELAERERRDGTDEAFSPDDAHTTTTYGPDGSVATTSEEEDEESDTAEGDAEEAAIKDEGAFDGPEAVDPATGEPLDEPGEPDGDEPESRRDVVDADAPASPESELEAETEARADAVDALDAPTDGKHAADDTTDDPSDDTTPPDEGDEPDIRRDVVDTEPAADEIDGAPVAVEPAPVPVAVGATTEDAPAAATPGSVPAPALDRLFADGDSFAERFREIQLRFVDSPKEATADAAALVGEAVDKLTAALTAQKESLGGDSDDTEQLRVQLRSYRDLLNRLSAL